MGREKAKGFTKHATDKGTRQRSALKPPAPMTDFNCIKLVKLFHQTPLKIQKLLMSWQTFAQDLGVSALYDSHERQMGGRGENGFCDHPQNTFTQEWTKTLLPGIKGYAMKM